MLRCARTAAEGGELVETNDLGLAYHGLHAVAVPRPPAMAQGGKAKVRASSTRSSPRAAKSVGAAAEDQQLPQQSKRKAAGDGGGENDSSVVLAGVLGVSVDLMLPTAEPTAAGAPPALDWSVNRF